MKWLFLCLLFSACAFEVPCVFCDVKLYGTIDGLDSSKNLQMRIRKTSSDSLQYLYFKKKKDLSQDSILEDYVYNEGKYYCAFFFIRLDCFDTCMVEWLVDDVVVSEAQFLQIRNRGIFFDDINLEITVLGDEKRKYMLGPPSNSEWIVNIDSLMQ